jgi:hypothetical protein
VAHLTGQFETWAERFGGLAWADRRRARGGCCQALCGTASTTMNRFPIAIFAVSAAWEPVRSIVGCEVAARNAANV